MQTYTCYYFSTITLQKIKRFYCRLSLKIARITSESSAIIFFITSNIRSTPLDCLFSNFRQITWKLIGRMLNNWECSLTKWLNYMTKVEHLFEHFCNPLAQWSYPVIWSITIFSQRQHQRTQNWSSKLAKYIYFQKLLKFSWKNIKWARLSSLAQ